MLGKLLKAVVDVVELPLAVVKDVVTLGGTATKGEFKPYTVEKIKELEEDLEDIT